MNRKISPEVFNAYSYDCPKCQAHLRALTEEELLVEVGAHLNKVHDVEMTEEQKMDVIRRVKGQTNFSSPVFF